MKLLSLANLQEASSRSFYLHGELETELHTQGKHLWRVAREIESDLAADYFDQQGELRSRSASLIHLGGRIHFVFDYDEELGAVRLGVRSNNGKTEHGNKFVSAVRAKWENAGYHTLERV